MNLLEIGGSTPKYHGKFIQFTPHPTGVRIRIFGQRGGLQSTIVIRKDALHKVATHIANYRFEERNSSELPHEGDTPSALNKTENQDNRTAHEIIRFG